jgi:hypothetical protein
MINLSRHAQIRLQQRGLRLTDVEAIVTNADVETPIGSNCVLLRVSREVSRSFRTEDRLSRLGVIWSEDHAQVVTVFPIRGGSAGRRYRARH